VSAGVAVLEIEGHFAAGPPRTARLVVEAGESALEAPPVVVEAGESDAWRASFAVPLALLDGATFALALGRLLVELPQPDVTEASGTPAIHHVRLAREANELRQRLDEADAALGAAERAAERAEEAEALERRAREELEAERDSREAALNEAVAACGRAEESLERERATVEERIAAARAEADERIAAAQAEAEERIGKAHVGASEQLATARADAEQRLAEQRAEAERHEEEAIAAERARASVTRHELRSARAELEALKRELAGRQATARRANGTSEEITARRTSPTEAATAKVGASDRPTEVVKGDDGETVRVISSRPPRPRHRVEDEHEPHDLPAGAAAIGARNLEPAMHSSSSSRLLAFVALGVAVLAAILVIFLRVGLV